MLRNDDDTSLDVEKTRLPIKECEMDDLLDLGAPKKYAELYFKQIEN